MHSEVHARASPPWPPLFHPAPTYRCRGHQACLPALAHPPHPIPIPYPQSFLTSAPTHRCNNHQKSFQGLGGCTLWHQRVATGPPHPTPPTCPPPSFPSASTHRCNSHQARLQGLGRRTLRHQRVAGAAHQVDAMDVPVLKKGREGKEWNGVGRVWEKCDRSHPKPKPKHSVSLQRT